MNTTPAKQNYRIPSEWYPHSATQLHWPSNRETWPGERLQRVEEVYLQIVDVLHKYEPIHLFVSASKVRDHVLSLFKKADINLQHITFHLQHINDVWARDCGPIFIRRETDSGEQFAITDWEYNAWGGKYPAFEDDNRLPKYLKI